MAMKAGDRVASILAKFGFKPCTGCSKRKRQLNRLFEKTDRPKFTIKK